MLIFIKIHFKCNSTKFVLKMEIDKIYLGDCLELMKEIPDKSIDCIICDLPYEVLNKNNANVQWDRIIPFEQLWG